jgi:hypothetical protein
VRTEGYSSGDEVQNSPHRVTAQGVQHTTYESDYSHQEKEASNKKRGTSKGCFSGTLYFSTF